MDQILEQGKILNYLLSSEQATKILGLIEDIRDAIIDYQVTSTTLVFTSSNFFFL